MNMVWYLTEAVGLLLAGQYLITPVVLYFYNKQTANPEFESFDLLSPPMSLPPSYQQSLSVMEKLGFHEVARLFGGKLATTVRAVLTVYVNPSEKDMAVVVHMLGEVPALSRVLLTYTEFYTVFADGSEICTSNSEQPAAFVQVPEKQLFRVPHLTDLRQLYDVHRAMTIRKTRVQKRLAPPGEEVRELIAGMKSDLAREARFGRLSLDEDGEWYRPTIKGAILNTLMFAWPVGMVRRIIQRRRGVALARAVLRNLSPAV